MYYTRLYTLLVLILLSKLSTYSAIHPRSDVPYIIYVLRLTLYYFTYTYIRHSQKGKKKKGGALSML